MNLTDIYKIPSKRKKRWRLGRGESSGSGKTSGKGHKGQKARSGISFSPTFAGGQMPLIRRLPKRGFKNLFKKQFAIVNVKQLNIFKDSDIIDSEKLKAEGIIKKNLDGVKILGDGELSKKLTVKAHKFTKNAIEKIKKAGGTVETIGVANKINL